MPSIGDYSLPAPRDWQQLEYLVWDLYREIWNDPDAQKVGTSGQSQNGVDIFGHPNRGARLAGVQVKRRRTRLTERELEEAVEAAKSFKPPLDEFTIVTSAPNDVRIQQRALELDKRHREQGLFSVTVLGWDEIERRLRDYPALIRKYYPHILPPGQSALDEEPFRPTFVKVPSGGLTCTETAFTPQWRIRQFSGDPISDLQWRFRGPRFRMDWRNASGDALERTHITHIFDLSLPPQQDEDGRVGVDELGLEIRYYWRGNWRRELHRWPISRRQLPTKVHWDVGDEILPPERWDE